MRTPFKFRDVGGPRADQAGMVGSALDITAIRDKLKEYPQFTVSRLCPETFTVKES